MKHLFAANVVVLDVNFFQQEGLHALGREGDPHALAPYVKLICKRILVGEGGESVA